MKCTYCEAELSREVLDEYSNEKLFGLGNVVIAHEALRYFCVKCGREDSVTVPDLGGLAAAVGVARASLPVRFNGREIKFLRRTMQVRAKNLATYLEVVPETLSRWENDHDYMKPHHDKLLRLLTIAMLAPLAPAVSFDPLAICTMDVGALEAPVANIEPRIVCSRIDLMELRVPNQRQIEPRWHPVDIAA